MESLIQHSKLLMVLLMVPNNLLMGLLTLLNKLLVLSQVTLNNSLKQEQLALIPLLPALKVLDPLQVMSIGLSFSS